MGRKPTIEIALPKYPTDGTKMIDIETCALEKWAV